MAQAELPLSSGLRAQSTERTHVSCFRSCSKFDASVPDKKLKERSTVLDSGHQQAGDTGVDTTWAATAW
jgi:hypothetical protein